MEHRIDAQTAENQLGQIMELAVNNNERFIVDRSGEPSVVILSLQELIRIAASPPEWLLKAWAGAQERGLETMTLEEVNSEIQAYRREKIAAKAQ